MKEAGAESIEFLLGDDNLSTLGSEGFDCINSFIIFQHIPLNRGYHLLRRLLSLLNEGGIAVLHFTYNTPTPDCAFTLKSRHGFAWYLRYRSYVVNGIMKLVEGNSFDKPLPVMQMNEYNLSSIHKLLYENECGEVYTRFTDHAGALGVLLFCRKVNRAAVIWCLSIFVAVSSDQQIERGGPIMDGLNDAFTNIRSMMQLVVHSWVTCRFVTFLGIDELRLMPVNQVENHSGLLKIGGLSAS